MSLCKIAKDEKFTLKIEYDTDAQDPREDDNLGTMVFWHRRHTLGDKHSFSVPEFNQLLKRKDIVSLPVYMLDHSGLTISTSSFNDPWDSGQLGFIYATHEDIRKWFMIKRVHKRHRQHASEILQAEVETYDQFLRGDVYGYILEDAEGVEISSCWGFYGLDYLEKELESDLPEEAQRLIRELKFA